jgi:hypothetical protein
VRRLLATVGVLAATAVAVGCGGGDPADDDQAAITTTLEKLFAAQEQGDAQTACEDLYVIQEPPRPGGEAEGAPTDGEASSSTEADAGEAGAGECETAFERAEALRRSEVHDLSTEVGAVEVDGDRATATVQTELTRSDGSALSQDVPYDLVRTPDGWRIRIADEG